MFMIGQLGTQFVPKNSIQLLTQMTTSSRLKCAIACHNKIACRTFDYDSISFRCRLFEGDLTTGSVNSSSSSTNSTVMTIAYSSDLYTSHNQECQQCIDSRYEQCINNICQCPSHTFWNGSQCLLQLFLNQTCSNEQGCRKDLNLTCLSYYLNIFTTCIGKSVNCKYLIVFQIVFFSNNNANWYDNCRF